MFVAPCNGVVHGVDRVTGRARWTYDARQDSEQPTFHGDALVTDDLIVFGSDGPRRQGAVGYVYALERATGRPRWKHRVSGGVTSDFVRDGDRLYAVTLEDELICLDVASGRLVWSFASGARNDERDFVFTTPALAGDRLFFGGLDGVVYAVDKRSGKRLWKREVGSPMKIPSLIHNGGLYVGSRDGRIHRLDPETGTLLRELAVGVPTGPLTPAADSFLLLVGVDERGETLKCLTPSLEKVRWTRDPSSGRWTSSRPYMWKDSVIAGSGKGELVAVSPTDGAILWSDKLEGMIRGIGRDDEVLYVGTLEGRLYAYRPPNASPTLGTEVPTHPMIGEPAPAFRLQDLTGRTTSLEDFRGRHVVLH